MELKQISNEIKVNLIITQKLKYTKSVAFAYVTLLEYKFSFARNVQIERRAKYGSGQLVPL